MTSTEAELREALDRFLQATRERRPVEYVGPALDRVLTLGAKIPDNADPMLRHYMERRSYQKAFDFLSSGVAEAERPQCGR